MKQPSDPKLSICISTFNRAAFLRETLESLIAQATDACEIVVADNASTDNTESVVASLALRFDGLRYIRQQTDNGLDRNFDRVIELARGEYCWLFSDDDLPKPGAVARVLKSLNPDLSLILLNIEFRTFDMSKVLRRSAMRLQSDSVYAQGELDRLFSDVDAARVYVGNIVIRRELWLSRRRERYYGSMFLHVAMIFQERLPGKVLAIAEPLISYRMGNTQSYSAILSETWLGKWPVVVDSLALSGATKKGVGNVEPWRNLTWLLILRARGLYSLDAYRRWIHPRVSRTYEKITPILIAMLPGILVNSVGVLYYLIRGDALTSQYLRLSRFHLLNQRIFRRR